MLIHLVVVHCTHMLEARGNVGVVLGHNPLQLATDHLALTAVASERESGERGTQREGEGG